MKRTTNLFTIAIIFSMLILTSCNGSVKGKWSDEDKIKFRTAMAEVDNLSELGENKAEWIDCYLKKCEATFSSFREADNDLKKCEELTLECNKDVLSNGSVLGNWSDKDKSQFRKDMNEIESLETFADKKATWIECYLTKCEATFSSYSMANTDEKGCEKLAVSCSKELFN